MKIAFLTAGGMAPCLSASIGRLIKNYSEVGSTIEMMGYLNGYKWLLLGKSISFSQNVIDRAEILYQYGGSPIGNSRVRLSNIDDCIKTREETYQRCSKWGWCCWTIGLYNYPSMSFVVI